jgi:DMSO reductase anchor subunit
MMNSLTLPTHPALLRGQAYFAARPKLTRALTWLSVLAVSLIVMLLATHVHAAGTLNGLTDGTATTACTEAKSLTTNKWLKVFILVAFGVGVVGVARKQRDGWTNLIWVIVIAALVGSVWQIAGVFGISCS